MRIMHVGDLGHRALFRELDQHAARRFRMQKGNPLSFGPQPRLLVDQLDPSGSAPRHRDIDIGNGNTNVMYPCAPARQILADRRLRPNGLQKLDQRLAALNRGDPRAVRVRHQNLGHAQHIPEKGQDGR